jgi:hypothetical protein
MKQHDAKKHMALWNPCAIPKGSISAGWWFGTWLLSFHILGMIIPTDELIFFRGVGQPPTSLDLCLGSLSSII